VPRFRRLPVFKFFLREYSRYFPSLSFLITAPSLHQSPPDRGRLDGGTSLLSRMYVTMLP
jgi:hypothetical protein